VGSDGEAGYLVPPRDAHAMAAAIFNIFSEPGRAERMGRNARRRIQRAFRWSETAAELSAVFEETIRAAHRRSRAT
jgi:glycosyltransferase involved in cell wall biosynthesis